MPDYIFTSTGIMLEGKCLGAKEVRIHVYKMEQTGSKWISVRKKPLITSYGWTKTSDG